MSPAHLFTTLALPLSPNAQKNNVHTRQSYITFNLAIWLVTTCMALFLLEAGTKKIFESLANFSVHPFVSFFLFYFILVLSLLLSTYYFSSIFSFSDDDDDDDDGVDNYDADDGDDIYIMMKCLSVTKHDHFRAERQRREVSRPLGLAGH